MFFVNTAMRNMFWKYNIQMTMRPKEKLMIPTRDEVAKEWADYAQDVLDQEKEDPIFPDEFKRILEGIASGKLPDEWE